MQRLRHAPLLFALTALFASGMAAASGYHFGSQSAAAEGTANASAAAADDATTIFFNPAGMSRLSGDNVSGVVDIVLPTGKFSDQGSSNELGVPITGNNGGSFVSTTVVPHAYWTHRLNPDMAIGVGMFVPFGADVKYDGNWVGRYDMIDTKLETVAINPSFSWKVTPKLSIGAGISAQYLNGKIIKGADFGGGVASTLYNTVLAQQMAANPGVPVDIVRTGVLNQLGPVIKALSANPNYSGSVDIKGDAWGTGFNFGLMYEYDKTLRFGVAYRSSVTEHLTGSANWNVSQAATNIGAFLNAVPGLPQGAGSVAASQLVSAYTDGGANLSVDTPESLSINAYKSLNDKLAIMADVTRTRHSRFQDLRVHFTNGLPDANTPEMWTDTTRYALGATYAWSDRLTLRTGIAYDESPVNANNRTPSIPDNDRYWISTGLNAKLTSASSVDLAISYIDLPSMSIDQYDNGGVTSNGGQVCDHTQNTSSCATVHGRYDIHSWLVGLQYNLHW
ncbi:MAG: transporter [Burkholderiales bacterium]|nr:transporter [Burkholderiales bacterium]